MVAGRKKTQGHNRMARLFEVSCLNHVEVNIPQP